jgi:hypothetical protein
MIGLPFFMLRITVEHATRSVELLNENSKGGEHSLWSRAALNAPPAKWFRLLEKKLPESWPCIAMRKNLRGSRKFSGVLEYSNTGN